MQRLKEETTLKERLIKNVQELEHRKMEVQRQLLTMNKDKRNLSSQLKSAIVIPK